jgi:hypothetical protein
MGPPWTKLGWPSSTSLKRLMIESRKSGPGGTSGPAHEQPANAGRDSSLKAWCRLEPKAWVGQSTARYPCTVERRVGWSPIFEERGAMPDVIASWIGTERGVHQLQYKELAKAKGMETLLMNH